jgi:hypothetical protein
VGGVREGVCAFMYYLQGIAGGCMEVCVVVAAVAAFSRSIACATIAQCLETRGIRERESVCVCVRERER